MDKFFTIVGAVLAIVALWLILSFLFALPVMWLWNWLFPELFGFKVITWSQAWGLLLLCSFLFKSSHVSRSAK